MIVQGLPHACGGVSQEFDHLSYTVPSSPRMWGCFPRGPRPTPTEGVFPTHVGVFLRRPRPLSGYRSLPHACGGVSVLDRFTPILTASSPRMWGCFSRRHSGHFGYGVFPTHVGVFLLLSRLPCELLGLPHACGGVSQVSLALRTGKLSSPRMWGQFSSRTTYQRRAFHALGHIQQELRDGQAPRTPDLEKPFQTIPPPGILLGGHAGSPARGRHGFKPCPFRRSGRG